VLGFSGKNTGVTEHDLAAVFLASGLDGELCPVCTLFRILGGRYIRLAI